MEILPSREVEHLFASAMIGLDKDELSPPEEPTGWLAIGRLHGIASREVLDAAIAGCNDADPAKRRVGAAVLGQLGHSPAGSGAVFAEERYVGLASLLVSEREGPGDAGVLNDVCAALGHLSDARAIPALLELRRHPDASVRFGVVFGLSGYDIQTAIDGLIELTADSDEQVRDWATFGLGEQIDTDTPAIRAALQARLNDPCIDARYEAIAGLARRHDLSVLPFLIRELQEGVAEPLLLDAAIGLARPELCDVLATLAADDLVVAAMRACGCRAAGHVGPMTV